MGNDAAGLGSELAGRTVTDPELVPVVLDGVSWWKRDDVAYEVTRKLTDEQNTALKQAILDEIRAGRPVEIGVDYQAGHPGNVDHKTDHWLYAVAVTHDDSGAPILVAYDNADVAKSTITRGHVVFFRLDEMGRFQHPAYFPTSQKPFSNRPHIIVNVRPASVRPVIVLPAM